MNELTMYQGRSDARQVTNHIKPEVSSVSHRRNATEGRVELHRAEHRIPTTADVERALEMVSNASCGD